MKSVVLICSIFSSASVHAFWGFNSDNTSSETPSLSCCPYAAPPPVASSACCPYAYPPPPPPPPNFAYYSSPPMYMSEPPLLPPPPPPPGMYAMLPPIPPSPPSPGFTQTYIEAPQSSTSSYSSSKSSDQSSLASTASKKSYSETGSQSSIIIDSTEDTSTDDDDDVSASEGTTSTMDQLLTSLFEQRDTSKLDLNCIIFNDSACSNTCNQVCLLYNFESTGTCTESKSCFCTIIGMKSPSMSLDQYQSLSLDDLWSYKFVRSTTSAKVLAQIKKYPKMSSKVLDMLRKPLRTGDDVKNRLMTAYPEWNLLRELKSRKRAPINRFIDDNYHLDKTALEKRIKTFAKKFAVDDIDKESADYLQRLSAFLDTIEDEKQLKEIFKQVNETKFKPLIKHTKAYLHDRGLDISIEDVESTECDRVDVDYVDNIVAGIVIKQILSTASQSKTSDIVQVTSTKSKKRKANSQNATSTYTKSKKMATTINQIDNSANPDQCSCSSESSITNMAIVTTKDVNDSTRWDLPGFDVYFLRDCYGSIDEVWNTPDYYVHFKRSSSGAIDLEWRKGYDEVYIQVSSSGAIDQRWRLNRNYITLSISSSGSITQSWNLGDVTYDYTKSSSGSVSRKWKNGNRDQNVLVKYQDYISSWCTANYFLIEMRSCVIY